LFFLELPTVLLACDTEDDTTPVQISGITD